MSSPIIGELANIKVTYDQFELQIPQCFREERQEFLDEIDFKINEINTRVIIENTSSSEINEDMGDAEENWSNSSQLISQKSSESEFNLTTYLYNEQKIIPQIIQGITEEDILKELAIKFIQKHIRAVMDRKIVNES